MFTKMRDAVLCRVARCRSRSSLLPLPRIPEVLGDTRSLTLSQGERGQFSKQGFIKIFLRSIFSLLRCALYICGPVLRHSDFEPSNQPSIRIFLREGALHVGGWSRSVVVCYLF